MSKTKKNNESEWIYSKYCVNCTLEGTYKCDMIVKEGECVNFTDCPCQCFGGY